MDETQPPSSSSLEYQFVVSSMNKENRLQITAEKFSEREVINVFL